MWVSQHLLIVPTVQSLDLGNCHILIPSHHFIFIKEYNSQYLLRTYYVQGNIILNKPSMAAQIHNPRLRQEVHKFYTSLGYITSSRTAWAS
jgi:hypothetical protein